MTVFFMCLNRITGRGKIQLIYKKMLALIVIRKFRIVFSL